MSKVRTSSRGVPCRHTLAANHRCASFYAGSRTLREMFGSRALANQIFGLYSGLVRLCILHYPSLLKGAIVRSCEVSNCEREHRGRGYCNSHYNWYMRHGQKEKPRHLIGFPTKRGVKLNPKNWTRENICWLAGILEGEGCWPNVKNRKRGILICAMTDKDIVERIKNIIGGGHIYYKKTKPEHKDQWQYTLSTTVATYAISCAVFPFMGIRRKARIKKLFKDIRIPIN